MKRSIKARLHLNVQYSSAFYYWKKRRSKNSSFEGWNHWNAITDSKSFLSIHSRTMIFAYAKRFIIFGWLNTLFCSSYEHSRLKIHEHMWAGIQKNTKQAEILCHSLLFSETLFTVSLKVKRKTVMDVIRLSFWKDPKGLCSIESHSFKGNLVVNGFSTFLLHFSNMKMKLAGYYNIQI